MLNDIKDYYRFKLYENCRILVNNLKDPIEEISMFLDKVLYPFILNNEEYERVVVDNIEITYENERFVWRIVENNELNIKSTKELNLYNVTDLFDGKEDYLNEVKKLMNDFPKELSGLSFISFMQTISHFVYNDKLIDDVINVFDICMISNNGHNNVVYEVQ